MEEGSVVITDKELFEHLVKENMKRAYFTALGLTGSHDMAMELSQEAFVRAYKSFNRFDKRRNFFTWYYRILKNLCINLKRDKKRKKEISFLEARNIRSKEDIQLNIESEELKEKLEIGLMKLDADAREIIILREFEEMDYKEIAALLDLPEGTVMSRLYYARKKLSEIIRSLV
jgi:RNA polymerase sigma-70 factor, ECF subfamily